LRISQRKAVAVLSLRRALHGFAGAWWRSQLKSNFSFLLMSRAGSRARGERGRVSAPSVRNSRFGPV